MSKHTLKEWVIAARPWSLPASVIPVLVTLSYLYYMGNDEVIWNWRNGWLGILGIMLLQTGGNLISDYHDFRQGVDKIDTYGANTLTTGIFTPSTILIYGIACLIFAVIIGTVIMFYSSWELIWIGAIGLMSALFYYIFKFRALGDLLIFITFGYLPVVGTVFIVTGAWDFNYLFLAFPIGAITVGILHANNTRDVVPDRQAHITTLAMLLKPRGSIVYYRLLIGLPYLIVITLIIYQILPLTTLLTLLSAPLALKNWTHIGQAKNGTDAISHLDEMTAKLQMAFGATLSLSLLIARWL